MTTSAGPSYSVQFNPRALLLTASSLVLLWLALTQGFSLLTIAIDVAVGWGLWAVPANWPHKCGRPS